MASPKHNVDLPVYSIHESRIVVYTTTGCPRCNMLKEWLKSRERDFEEKDLDDVDTMAELVMRNEVVLSAPALEVGKALYRQDEIFDGNGRINGELLRILEGK